MIMRPQPNIPSIPIPGRTVFAGGSPAFDERSGTRIPQSTRPVMPGPPPPGYRPPTQPGMPGVPTPPGFGGGGIGRGGTIVDPEGYSREQERRRQQAEADKYRREMQARANADRERQLEAQRTREQQQAALSLSRQEQEQQRGFAEYQRLQNQITLAMDPQRQEQQNRAFADRQERLIKQREADVKRRSESLRAEAMKEYEKQNKLDQRREAIMQSYAGRGMYGSDAMRRELDQLNKDVEGFEDYFKRVVERDPNIQNIRGVYARRQGELGAEARKTGRKFDQYQQQIKQMGAAQRRPMPMGTPTSSQFTYTPSPEVESYRRYVDMLEQGNPFIVGPGGRGYG
jgi:hypothetical protein